MLNRKQPKKSNISNIRYTIINPNPSEISKQNKCSGIKLKKSKDIRSNLSNLSMHIQQCKENISIANLMASRHNHASLLASDVSHTASISRSRSRNPNDSHKKQKKLRKVLRKVSTKKNTLMIGNDTHKTIKQRKMSVPNYNLNAVHIARARANQSVLQNQEEDFRRRLAENRKKYNLSCGDMIDKKSKSKNKENTNKILQKNGQKQKKNNNDHIVSTNKLLPRKSTLTKSGKNIINNKSQKFKKIQNKSRNNTIQVNVKVGIDKKKDKNNKKVANNQRKKKQSKKMKAPNNLFIFQKSSSSEEKNDNKASERQNINQYPVKKYLNRTQKNQRDSYRQRVSPNRQINNDNINEISTKKISYNFQSLPLNEGSSGIFGGYQELQQSYQNQKTYIYLEKQSQSQSNINIQEIKEYENNSPLRKPHKSSIFNKNLDYSKLKEHSSSKTSKSKPYGNTRSDIIVQLESENIALNQQELYFLAGVVLIQRKWRQYKLKKRISAFVNRNPIIPSNINAKTQYYIEEQQPRSKQNQNQREDQIYRDKEQILSKTKLAEVEQDEKKQSAQLHISYEGDASNVNIKVQESSEEQLSQTRMQFNHTKYNHEETLKQSHQDLMKQSPYFINLANNESIFTNEFMEQKIIDHWQTKNEAQQIKYQQQKRQQAAQKQIQKQSSNKNNSNIQIVNYSRLYQDEFFPELTYLEYRKNLIKGQFDGIMKIITEQKMFKKITDEEFYSKKQNVTEIYMEQIAELKKTKYTIKKGYLKYIDCLNVVKKLGDPKLGKKLGISQKKRRHRTGHWNSSVYEHETTLYQRENNQSNNIQFHNQHEDNKQNRERNRLRGNDLRRVSSQDNFMSMLYNKLFQFDSCLSEWSSASQSMELLSKKMLVRKQFYNTQAQNRSKRKRGSMEDLRSLQQYKNSAQLLQSNRSYTKKIEANKFSSENNIQAIIIKNKRVQPLNIESRQDQRLNEFKFSSQLIPGRSQEIWKPTNNKSLWKGAKFINFDESEKSEEEMKDQQCNYIENWLIMHLTKQFEQDLHAINPTLVEIILLNEPFENYKNALDFPDIENSQSDNETSYYHPVLESLGQQLKGIQSPRFQHDDPQADTYNYHTFSQFNQQQHKQKSPSIPQQHSQAFSSEGIQKYLKELISYISKTEQGQTKLVHIIVDNMNSNQAFQPLTYLKFLRDFQIPDDEYVPIINNEQFIEWENYYIDKIDLNEGYGIQNDRKKQSIAIFHRCIFECFLTQLEKRRPYGERGRPFPWQHSYTPNFQKQIRTQQIPIVLQKCLQQVIQSQVHNCGIIEEKHIINFQEDLQRIHEQNQDRIIDMLEKELIQSKTSWYQIQDHNLQIKMEITFELEVLLIQQFSLKLAEIIFHSEK